MPECSPQTPNDPPPAPEAVGAYFTERDAFWKLLGIELQDIAPGRASVAMTVRPEHVSFNGACHGGVIFALADSAFGAASNSHGVVAVGIDTHTVFSTAAYAGDVLTARAEEASRSRRLASYRVTVARGSDTIATFTGTVYIVGKPHGN